jgi:predicted small lipoprotein YifL
MKNKGPEKKTNHRHINGVTRNVIKSMALLMSLMWLSACGNKGDLYLPDKTVNETAANTETEKLNKQHNE